MKNNVVVRYETAAESADENARLVADVYAALAVLRPAGFRYVTYRLADGVTFVHVANVDDAATNPLVTLPEFAEFQRELGSRVVAPPVASNGSVVGSYGFEEAK